MFDKNLLQEAKKSRRYLGFTIGLGMLTALFIVLQAGLLARILNEVFLAHKSLGEVRFLLGLLLPVVLLRALVAVVAERLAYRSAARIKEDLRQRLLARLLALGPVQIRGERTGELVNVLVEGVEAIEAYFARYLPQAALAALAPLLFLVFVFPLDLLSGWILLLTAPLIPLFMILIGKWADSLSQKQWQSLSRMSAHFLDVLQGITTLKVFGRSKTQIEVIARISDSFRQTTLGVLRVAFLSALVLELLSTLSTALVAVGLGLRLVYGHISLEQAFFVLLLAPEFYLPLRQLGTQFHAGMAGASAAQRIFEILDLPAEASSGTAEVPAGAAYASAGTEEGKPQGKSFKEPALSPDSGFHLSVQNIHFTYDREQDPVLRGVSFELFAGERVALVGASGAGKSTLAALLLGLIRPGRGQITVTEGEGRRRVAFVPQHPHLFSGTVAENIRLGCPDAAPEDVIAAAELAGAHEFIGRLPQGYTTPVGEGGTALSGGQVQRLALARAFLTGADLLILDEATSGLDQGSEQHILESLRQWGPDKTVLVIAHRLDLAAGADRILVLQEGRIAEEGKHEELLGRQGVYHQLVLAYGGAG